MKKKILAIMVMLCCMMIVLPVMAVADPAPAEKNVMLGDGGIDRYNSEDGYDYVYYGQSGSSPIKWRVLLASGGNGGTYTDGSGASIDGSDAMFLLSENVLSDKIAFDANGNGWSSSDIRTWILTNLYNGSGVFTAAEKAQILQTTTTGDTDVIVPTYVIYACQLSGDTLFLLSADEATRSVYGFGAAQEDDNNRILEQHHWWLRSGSSYSGHCAIITSDRGLISSLYADRSEFCITRPAFNLHTGSILFSTAADFDKSDDFAINSVYADSEWKLTLQDGNTAFAASLADISIAQGNDLTVEVSGLGSGADYTQVSAMLVAEDGDVIGYGKIGNAATGAKTFTIPSDLAVGDYTLRVFAEEINGVNLTDYASNTEDFSLRVCEPQPVYLTGRGVKLTDGSVWFVLDDGGENDLRITLIKDGFLDGAYTRPEADTAIESYQTQARNAYSDNGAAARLPASDDLDGIDRDFTDESSGYWLSDIDGSFCYYTAGHAGSVWCLSTDVHDVRPALKVLKSQITVVEAMVTEQPEDLDWPTLAGQNAVFSVAADGENVTYQWQVKNGVDWTNIAGATESALTLSNGDANYAAGRIFRCKMYSDWGEYFYSGEAVLRIFNWQEYGGANAVEDRDYSIEVVGDEISVYTAAGLGWVAAQVNNGDDGLAGKKIILEVDADLTGRAWIPIGNLSSQAFEGDFDGNMRTVRGLDINYEGAYIGLFGYVKDATVENLIIADGTVRGSGNAGEAYVGALFGYGNSSTFQNIGVGEVMLVGNTDADTLYVGGIGGILSGKEGCAVFNCYSRATVSSRNTTTSAGGIAGYARYGSSIENCYFAGTFDAGAGASVFIGAIAGVLDQPVTDNVSSCYWQIDCGALYGHWDADADDAITASDDGCISKTKAQIKAASGDGALLSGLNDWVTMANGSNSTYKTWTICSLLNGSYPTLFTVYDLYVGGIPVTNVNCDNVLSDAGTPTVVFNPNINTLALNNASISITDANVGFFAAIEGMISLNIDLAGKNTVSGSGTEQAGIYLTGNAGAQVLSFSGRGTLMAEGIVAVCVKTYGNHEALSLASNLIVKEGGSIAHEHSGSRDFWTFSDGTFDASDMSTYSGRVVIGPKTSPSSSSSLSYNYYNITATAGEGGGISPSGKVSIRELLDKTFTITAVDGYVIEDVLIDGVSVGAVSEYTFEKVSKTYTIKAVFAKGTAWVNPFKDVGESDWFYSAVKYVVQNGLMNGTSDTTFEPNLATSRAMIVTILWRLENQPAVSALSDFRDVADGEYYAKAVAWAEENGIVNGYDAATYGPGDTITREQLAAIFYRYAQYRGYHVNAAKGDILSYNDANQISGYALPAIEWACGAGLMNGETVSTFNPGGIASRAEVAAVLMRFAESVAK